MQYSTCSNTALQTCTLLIKKHEKNTKKLIEFVEFPFDFFLSSDTRKHILFYFFFFPPSQKIPFRDPPTVEYRACALIKEIICTMDLLATSFTLVVHPRKTLKIHKDEVDKMNDEIIDYARLA